MAHMIKYSLLEKHFRNLHGRTKEDLPLMHGYVNNESVIENASTALTILEVLCSSF